MLLMVLQCWGK